MDQDICHTFMAEDLSPGLKIVKDKGQLDFNKTSNLMQMELDDERLGPGSLAQCLN